jgi:hypothetical protein
MDESENTVHERATHGDEIPKRVCSQLLCDEPRYSLWHARHARRMTAVAELRRRERQILGLRSAALEQIHGTALVRYLREYRVTGARRDQTLEEFYGVADLRCAAIAAHRNYLVVASSQLCTFDLLDLAGDTRGVDLVRSYENTYGQFFSMFCDRARAKRNCTPYLLSALIPEARENAERLRARILSGQLLPPKPARIRVA